MKCSELIQHLASVIAEYGDLLALPAADRKCEMVRTELHVDVTEAKTGKFVVIS